MKKSVIKLLAIIGAITAVCTVLFLLRKKIAAMFKKNCKCCKDGEEPETVEDFIEETTEDVKDAVDAVAEKTEDVVEEVKDNAEEAKQKAEAIAEEFKDYADVELPKEE